MIQLSKFPFKTTKSNPQTSDNKSTSILLKAWLIRQVMAWAYTYTTLWLEVIRNIEKIVREEMDKAWCFETYMPALSPRELWDKTKRWDAIDVFFHVAAANNKEYWLNCTHEELVTPLLWEFIQSYKDLPTCVYQIQSKFRNEKRAKSWLLRWREFIMKDAYSFHKDDEGFIEFYENMKKVYMNVFNRLWIWQDTYIALADWWTFTDKYSHEFQTILPIWEDTLFIDKETWECFNQEVAPAKVWKEFNNLDEEKKQMTEILWEWIIWVSELAKFLKIEVERTTKTILFENDLWEIIATAVRWDYDINEIKLRKIIWCKSLKLLDEEKVRQITWAEVWYAWVINLPENVKIYFDDSCENRVNFEMWANKTHYHSINVNFWLDLEKPEKFYDFKNAKAWDKNPKTWNVYELKTASEVWNIFPLETKFSSAFWLKYLDENNEEKTPLMWCYGIWISRLMWVIAEYFLNWEYIERPESIAPADYYIIVIWENNFDKAKELGIKLEKEWKKVILDDRFWKKFWFWQKASDCDLLWIPNRIVVSDKTIEQGWYELKKRGEKEGGIFSF